MSYVTKLHNRFAKRGEANDITYSDSWEGPEHSPTWTSECKIKGEVKGVGKGPNKQQAKEEAAGKAFQNLGYTD